MFLPPEKKGHETVALTVSFSLSSYVVFKSSVYDLSKDNFAVGAKSDLAIDLSLIDCSYSNFAIIKSGLFFFESSIAKLRSPGSS